MFRVGGIQEKTKVQETEVVIQVDAQTEMFMIVERGLA